MLASGRVKIKHLTADGKETILAFIEEGEIFGELALLGDSVAANTPKPWRTCRSW